MICSRSAARRLARRSCASRSDAARQVTPRRAGEPQRAALLVDRDHRQVRRAGVARLPSGQVLGLDPHADLHRAAPRGVDARAQGQDLAGCPTLVAPTPCRRVRHASGLRLDDVPKRAWLPNSPTTQEPLDGRSMRHVQSSHPGRFGQAVAAASRQLPKTTRRVYRSAPTPCMSFFSRLRASASTWSFQRCVVHSGLLELAIAPDSAVPRLACDDSIGLGRSLLFRSSVGTALDVDMSHLRSVVAGAVIKTAMSDCAGLSGATRLMAPG
jgi:hypothetical protein